MDILDIAVFEEEELPLSGDLPDDPFDSLLVSQPRGAQIGDYRHVLGLGMELQGHLQVLLEAEVFQDPREEAHLLHNRRVEVADPAEDNGSPWKEVVPVLDQKVQGFVVRGDQQVEIPLHKLVLVELVELLHVVRVHGALRVHILHFRVNRGLPLQDRFYPLDDHVCPGGAFVVRAQNEDLPLGWGLGTQEGCQ